MSSRIQELDSDLTTDAVPSPSRSNEKINEETVYDDLNDKGCAFENRVRANLDNCNLRKNRHKINHIPSSIPGGFSHQAQATIINISNSKNIQVGDTIHNYLGNTVESKTRNTFIETAAIRALKVCNEPVTKDDLLLISGYMDEHWKDVIRTLDITDAEIRQFSIDHREYGIKEVIYQLLLVWIQTQPDKASVGRLANVLWEKNQGDALIKWSEKKRC